MCGAVLRITSPPGPQPLNTIPLSKESVIAIVGAAPRSVIPPDKAQESAMAQATVQKQNAIIANQRAIVRNQQRILRHQTLLPKLMRNQTRILRNQDAIIKNQKKILRAHARLLAREQQRGG